MILFVIFIKVKSSKDVWISVRRWTKQVHGCFCNMQIYIAKRENNGILKKEGKKRIKRIFRRFMIQERLRRKGLKLRFASHHTECFIGLLLAKPIIRFIIYRNNFGSVCHKKLGWTLLKITEIRWNQALWIIHEHWVNIINTSAITGWCYILRQFSNLIRLEIINWYYFFVNWGLWPSNLMASLLQPWNVERPSMLPIITTVLCPNYVTFKKEK